MFATFKSAAVVLIAAVVGAQAESHTIHFDNRCGFGKPTLISGDKILSTGGDFTIDGPLKLAIAYLQAGNCGLQGENCTLIETTLINPTSPGTGSGTDISLIPPHAFSGPASFMYYNGCDGKGVKCDSPTCNGAAHNPSDPFLQTICLVNDVNLAITFC